MNENLNEMLGIKQEPNAELPNDVNKTDDCKKNLAVSKIASSQLSTINTILLVVAIAVMFVGVIMCLVGLDDLSGYYSDPTTFIAGISLAIFALNIFIVRIFVASLIVITRGAEYYTSQMEEKFKIED